MSSSFLLASVSTSPFLRLAGDTSSRDCGMTDLDDAAVGSGRPFGGSEGIYQRAVPVVPSDTDSEALARELPID